MLGLLVSRISVAYTDACCNKINNNDDGHSSLEKYTSHTLFEIVAKGLRKGYVWKVSWRLNRDCNILTPSSSVFSSTSFSFSWAAQPGALRAQPSAESWFSLPRTATSDSKLAELPVAQGYIIVWHPPASCERHICTEFKLSTVKAIPWYLRPDEPVLWSTAGSEINMLYIGRLSNLFESTLLARLM